jgi:hypothetical protein
MKDEKKLGSLQVTALWLITAAGMAMRILDGIKVPVFMDEIPILYNVAHFISDRTLTPVHFSYPSLFSLLAVIPTVCIFIVGYLMQGYPVSGLGDSTWLGFLFRMQQDRLVFGGRIVSMVAFAGILWFLYRKGRRSYGFVPLLIGFAMLSFDPLGGLWIQYSRYALPDVTAAFWVTMGMLLCFETVSDNKNRLVMASFVIGLGISTKYNAAMAVFPLLVTWIINNPLKRLTALPRMLGSGLAGFVLGSPAMLWASQNYWAGYLWESRHMADGHLGAYDVNYLWIFRHIQACGTWMLPFIVLALLTAVIRREKKDWIFLALFIPSFLVIGRFEKKSIHYFFFLYPVLALFIGRFISIVWSACSRRWMKLGLGVLIAALFLVYPGYRALKMIKRDWITDNRLLAETWIERHIPSGSRLVLDHHMFTHLMTPEDQEFIQSFIESENPHRDLAKSFLNRPYFQIVPLQRVHRSPDTLAILNPDYIIISGQNYRRLFEEDSTRIPDKDSPLYREFILQKTFFASLMAKNSRYRLVQNIAGPAGGDVRIYRRRESRRNQW